VAVITVDNGQVEISGSGIGLAIVKRICKRQRWQIEIESQVDQGTIVRLDLSHKT